jgi:hypothetical protein
VRGLGDWPRRRSAEDGMCESDSRVREHDTFVKHSRCSIVAADRELIHLLLGDA